MQPGMAMDPAPNPGLIFENLNAHQRSAALRTAIEIDLFRAVGQGPADALTLAGRCSASPRGIRILSDFLVVMGLLSKSDGIYSHTPTSALFLDPNSPSSLHSTARFLGLSEMKASLDNLTEIVRTGRTTLPGDGSVEPDNPIWVEFAHSMAPMMGPLAGPLGTIVLNGRTGPMRILDIAAGHGLFGIEIAKQHPEARIVACDWPKVLDVAEENARKAGVADRFERLPGSAFDVDFGGPYDAVLLTNFLHHFDVPTCTGLLKKVRAALKPGGLSATLEFVPNEDRVTPPMPAAFSLVMLVSTRAGDAYTFSEYTAMHREAGFGQIEAHPVPRSPHTVVTGIAQ
ncbi:class I SAM-dependent methyltransferase [uncultured Paludibaculum sp.]|uniref:class I SAM-dependent methyltransferase n=1 Tax=uncultured Paludibaculum sp. TaxID=1765020 RepID=UPI002AAAC84D|nr:class I SAM-dependent methyltransferase [uncultured Paludibaculum sp.]